MTDPNTACEHGHQRRKCPHCELIQAEHTLAAARRLAEYMPQAIAGLRLADDPELAQCIEDALRAFRAADGGAAIREGRE